MAWYRGCKSPEDKRKREEFILNNQLFARMFLDILRDEYETIDRKGFREEDYEDTNWTFLQAFRNGKLAQINKIAELFTYLDRGKE